MMKMTKMCFIAASRERIFNWAQRPAIYLLFVAARASQRVDDDRVVTDALHWLYGCQHRIRCRRMILLGVPLCVNRFFNIFVDQRTQHRIQLGALFRRVELLLFQIDGRRRFRVLDFARMLLVGRPRQSKQKHNPKLTKHSFCVCVMRSGTYPFR